MDSFLHVLASITGLAAFILPFIIVYRGASILYGVFLTWGLLILFGILMLNFPSENGNDVIQGAVPGGWGVGIFISLLAIKTRTIIQKITKKPSETDRQE